MALAPPAQAAGDLRIEATTTYELVPNAGQLRVTIGYTLTNQKPDTVTETTITQYFFDRHRVAVPFEAREMTAFDSAGGSLSLSEETVVLDDGTESRIVNITLPGRIYYQETQRFSLSFVLEGGEPRTTSTVRANPAYAAFRVRAWGDPGLSDVAVTIPSAFEVEHSGSDVTFRAESGHGVWHSDDIAEPAGWTVFFNVRNDAELATVSVDLAEMTFRVRSWPGDDTWAAWAVGVLEDGFTELADAIGLAVDEPRLDIVESLDPALTGYAGWYLLDEDVIELGESLDDRVLLHELAHLWFNRNLFEARWINEGLANAYASEIEPVVSGEAAEEVTLPDEPGGAIALNAWTVPATNPALDLDVARRERYGYDTSEYLVTTLLDEIGVDHFAEIFRSASHDVIAYRDGAGSESVGPADDWRRFLDLLEEVGGSQDAEGLFLAYVAADTDLKILATRREARVAYAALLESDGGWTAPVVVRRGMADWDFPQAHLTIETSLAIIAARDAIASAATSLDLAAPASLQHGYEAASTHAELTAALTLGGDQLRALDTLIALRRALDAPRGFFTSVGLRGHDLESRWSLTTAAFAAGDDPRMEATAAEITMLLEAAHAAGRTWVLRLGATVAAALLAALAGIWLFIRRRSSARRT